VFDDDIIVIGATVKEHCKNLDTVLKRLASHRLKLSVNKNQFAQAKLKILGHIVTKSVVNPDSENVKAIQDVPTPKTLKEMKQFMGAASYYRRYIQGFAFITRSASREIK